MLATQKIIEELGAIVGPILEKKLQEETTDHIECVQFDTFSVSIADGDMTVKFENVLVDSSFGEEELNDLTIIVEYDGTVKGCW